MDTPRPERDDEGPLPYHRLARIGPYRWWKPLLELLLLALLALLMTVAVVLPALFVELLSAESETDGAGGLLVLGAGIAVLLPAAVLAARIIRGRWRPLLSVDGVVRWRWLGACLVVAGAYVLLAAVVEAGFAAADARLGPPPGEWVGWAQFVPLALAVVVAIVPQAAAEEVVFRGSLVQAFGAWVRPSWFAVLLSSVVFGLAHGLELPLLVATGWLGVVCAWLTIRTGGLEAAVALHVLNNVSYFLVEAAAGRSHRWVTEINLDVAWPETLVEIALMALYAVAIAAWHSRRSGAVRVERAN